MSEFRVYLTGRVLARLEADAKRANRPFGPYLGTILRDIAQTRMDVEARQRRAALRTADPPRLPPAASAARPARIHTDALDAALDRAGIIREREG